MTTAFFNIKIDITTTVEKDNKQVYKTDITTTVEVLYTAKVDV